MLNFYFYEYLIFFFFFLFVGIVSSVLLLVSYFFIFFEIFFVDFYKNSKYECGFESLKFYKYKRENFDIKFFLIGVLFIIFDLEIIFLFPWSVNLFSLDFHGVVNMHYFLLLMALGFAYEYKKGALIW